MNLMWRTLAGLALAVAFVHSCRAVPLQETPLFADAVKKGVLPPVAERVPEQPRVIDLAASGREPGMPGGTLRMLIGDQREISQMTIYGYARLVIFDEKLQLVPDILDHYEVKEGRIFTLYLRRGHKWSDGQPFTSEDFRYYWEDVANNAKLSPGGIPQNFMVNGKPPRFEVLDPLTVRYTWDDPNPGFLPALAGAQPLYLTMPAHYLKQFHVRYADKETLTKEVKKAGVKDWAGLHERKSRQYRPDNPDLPTLDPWRNRTRPPADNFVFERNPFFHRIDTNGRQLPYIDRAHLLVSTTSLIPARAGGGEVDLQARYISFDSYTFLKEAEARGEFKVRLWDRGEGSYAALVPNQNAADPTWRSLVRDVRFRRALSLGINRQDINRVIFFGLAQESANTILRESPLYRDEYRTAWTAFDPAKANQLLDEVGLTKRAADGTRLLPDGRRAEIIVDTQGAGTNETDMVELINDDYRAIGVKIFAHTSSPDMFRRRIYAGETVMSLASGLDTGIDNGTPTADMEPSELAPSAESQLRWPLWGTYVATGGRQGEAIGVPEAKELADLLSGWRSSLDVEQRTKIWNRMLEINADQVFSIGIVNRVPQPIVVSSRLRNVPEKGLYSFLPGAFLGKYMPDTFWFAGQTAED
ncbi:MAG: ABC transporter substrate-binding protein [Methylobacteriaceae bacterium]|nr:ABC transporter substrate-binding protein [Methylobacteriaceae bacterium]MBV9246003.1 ABC transporter substrate-binding protein [Methylobacteriaceae bacterium]